MNTDVKRLRIFFFIAMGVGGVLLIVAFMKIPGCKFGPQTPPEPPVIVTTGTVISGDHIPLILRKNGVPGEVVIAVEKNPRTTLRSAPSATQSHLRHHHLDRPYLQKICLSHKRGSNLHGVGELARRL
jgi:hypothetical protein